MPCYDAEAAQDRITNSKMAAVLCNLTKYLGLAIVVRAVNWEEAGVTQQEYLDWYEEHVKADARRIAREHAQKGVPPEGWQYRIEISNRPTQYAMNADQAREMMMRRGVGDTWFVYDRNGNIPPEFVAY